MDTVSNRPADNQHPVDRDDDVLLLRDDLPAKSDSQSFVNVPELTPAQRTRAAQHGRIRKLVRELRTARWLASLQNPSNASAPAHVADEPQCEEQGLTPDCYGGIASSESGSSRLSGNEHAETWESPAPIAPAETQSSINVIPPRDIDDDQSIDEYLSRLLTRVCGEEAARDYARNRETVGAANGGIGATASGASAQTNSGSSSTYYPEPPSGVGVLTAVANSDLRRDATMSERRIQNSDHENRFDQPAVGGSSSDLEFDCSPVSAGIAAVPGSPLAPRPATRETQVDLTQLRALANASARTAIAAHVNRLRLQSARSKLFSLVLFAISATIGLYVADGDQLWSLVGVLGAYLLAAAWLIRAIRLAQTIPPTSELDQLNGLAPTRGAH